MTFCFITGKLRINKHPTILSEKEKNSILKKQIHRKKQLVQRFLI